MRQAFYQPAWTLDEIKTHCTRAARDSFPEWYGDDWKKAYDIYYKNFISLRETNGIHALKGAESLLKWLKTEKIPTFIVSNKRGDLLRQEVETIKWQDFFVRVVGAQDAAKDKPEKEHVEHALKDTGFKSEASVWFIGDSETDIKCALNAGCTPVLIGTEEEAKKLGVELFFSDCQALQTLLYNQAKKTEVAS